MGLLRGIGSAFGLCDPIDYLIRNGRAERLERVVYDEDGDPWGITEDGELVELDDED